MNATAQIDDESRTTYVIGQTEYVESTRPAYGWQRPNRTEQTGWGENTPAGRPIELLEITNVYYRGERSLAGTSTHGIEGSPSASNFRDVNPPRHGSPAQGGPGEIQHMTVRLWIYLETNRPLRADHSIEIDVQEETGVIQFSYRFTAYNASLSIAVPAAVYEHLWETGCPR